MKQLLILSLLFASAVAHPHSYSIDHFTIDGGGGVSTDGHYFITGGISDTGGAATGEPYLFESGLWPFFSPAPGAPTLFINYSGHATILFWFSVPSEYLLEHNNDLAGTNGWSALPVPAASMNGVFYVTNAIVPGSDFYRLRSR